MKRKFSLLLILFSFLFVSCGDAYYYNLNKYEEAKKKTTYKPFSHLNKPIVFSMTINDVYALFGKSKNKQFTKSCGEVFVIFDWEKGEVFDWVYYPTSDKGFSHGRAGEHVYNGKTKYYFTRISGKELAELDPEKTEVTVYSHDIYYSRTSYNSEGKYIFINSDRLSMPAQVNLYAFDTVEKKFLPPFYYETYEYLNPYPVTDKDGNVYISREYEKTDLNSLNEDKKEWYTDILKISFEDGKSTSEIVKTFSQNYHFDKNRNEFVKYCFSCETRIDDYLFIVEDGFGLYSPEKIIIHVYNTKKEQFVEKINIDFNKESMIVQFVKHSENYYAILYKTNDEHGISPLYFLKLDIDGNITTEQIIKPATIPNVENDNSMYNMYMRDSRLYMVENALSPTKFKIYYYDFETNTMQSKDDAIILELDEIVGLES